MSTINATTAIKQLAMPSMMVSIRTRYRSFCKSYTLDDEDPSPSQEASDALHLLDSIS